MVGKGRALALRDQRPRDRVEAALCGGPSILSTAPSSAPACARGHLPPGEGFTGGRRPPLRRVTFVLFCRGRCPHRPESPPCQRADPPYQGEMSSRDKRGREVARSAGGILTKDIFGIPQSRPRKVHSTWDAQARASLAAVPCSSSPQQSLRLCRGPHIRRCQPPFTRGP